jgi:hypothetical protein
MRVLQREKTPRGDDDCSTIATVHSELAELFNMVFTPELIYFEILLKWILFGQNRQPFCSICKFMASLKIDI